MSISIEELGAAINAAVTAARKAGHFVDDRHMHNHARKWEPDFWTDGGYARLFERTSPKAKDASLLAAQIAYWNHFGPTCLKPAWWAVGSEGMF